MNNQGAVIYMKSILKILYGNLNIRKKTDYVIVPLKVLYIVYSIPFLVFAFLLLVRSFGAFGSAKDEKFSNVKKILLHFADVFLSYCLWIAIFGILEDTLGLKGRFHLFN